MFGVDFSAVLALAEAMGATTRLLVDLLPEIETIMVAAHQDRARDGD